MHRLFKKNSLTIHLLKMKLFIPKYHFSLLKLPKGKSNTRTLNVIADYPVSNLTPSIIKERLKKYNLPFVDGPTSFRLPECKMCSPLKKKSAAESCQTFVNKQTGYFLCELCKCSGPWEVLERLMTYQCVDKQKSAKEVQALRQGCVTYHDKSQQAWKNITQVNPALHLLGEDQFLQVVNNFEFKMSVSIAEKLNIYVSEDRQRMYLPIVSINQLVLGHIIVEKEFQKVTVVPRNNCAGLLIYAQKKKQNSAVIVSNLQDFFALVSSQVSSAHVLCLPYGVGHLSQLSLPFLENYETLTLWLGSVPGSWDATRSFAKKLNEKRCHVIRSPDHQVTPTEALDRGIDLRKLLEQAQPTWHQAITTFAALRGDVLQELRNHEQVLGVTWTRFPALNKILRGHRRGELTILTGPTGSGKTTFMAEYSLDLAMQGVNTLWGSFEVRNVRLAKTMLQQFVGCPLESSLEKFDAWANEFERLPIFFLTFHGQQSVRHVMDAVQHSAYIHDIGHVIIDNVQFMMGMTDDNKSQDRFYKQDLIIHAFRTFATRANCHVTLVIHPRKERDAEELTAMSIFGGAKAAQEADNVMIIQDQRLNKVRGRKYLQIAKNRYTGDLGIMQLDFDKDALSFRNAKKRIIKEDVSEVRGSEVMRS